MKLELKHLAPYLPYELKVCIMGETVRGTEHDDNPKPIVFELVGLDIDNVEYHEIGRSVTEQIVYSDCFPVLRPLSEFGDSDDVRKVHEFLGLGNWCEMYDDYFREWFNDSCSIDKLVLQAPQDIFNYFLANHYDVFSLIPKKLAVDIKILKYPPHENPRTN